MASESNNILTNHSENHKLFNGNGKISDDSPMKPLRDGSPHKNSSKHKRSSNDTKSPKDGFSEETNTPKNKDHRSSKHHDDQHRSSSSKSHSSGDKGSSSQHKSKSPSKSKDGHSKHSSDKHKREHSTSSGHKIKKEPGSDMVVNSETISDQSMSNIESETIIKREKPTSPIRSPVKREPDSDEDNVPLAQRHAKSEPRKRPKYEEESDDEPLLARAQKLKKKASKRKSASAVDEAPKKKLKIDESPRKGKKKKEEEPPKVWKWWEEERRADGVKWNFLEHKGPVFAPEYEPLPHSVNLYYNGKKCRLTQDSEEIATFYGRMIEHDYTTKDVFNKNFMKDWRKCMTESERSLITDLKKCNFNEINEYFKEQSEKRKSKSKEEKKELKTQNEAITKEYGFCAMDGHTEKIGNFRIEPPGLFRGRGDHPKQGMLKKRILPKDVIINCSKGSKVPVAPEGHKWKEVRHDNNVTWLASWTENVQGQTKYVMLNASSKLKGEKDWQKYEIARKLHKHVDRIRAQYQDDWKSKEMRVRQRAVALYFIDKLALRAGNEKEEGETADTVGCCSLRVEHITLHEEKNGREFVVDFDFLGKDSIRYTNTVPVEKRVFKNLQLFMNGKSGSDDLFDRLNTGILNKHLTTLMDGLSAKVFRTFNASKTLQEQLDLLTIEDDSVPAKMLAYNRANRAVAVLCNHQRAAPKNFDKQMQNLQEKIDAKHVAIKDAKLSLKQAKSEYKAVKNEKNKQNYERRKIQVDRLLEQLMKLEVQATDKDENKEIALGTSKLNYLDPRISVAWCKKWDVPLEKIYNKTQRDKFAWAIDMTEPDFKF